ncbi:hypothetical protein K438DRAFT_1764675 [Mycena galopus ATCC 62051]|nr:hypothetical protein K438DRAFT_1764675 [Mycena galopus ATCC 62051]
MSDTTPPRHPPINTSDDIFSSGRQDSFCEWTAYRTSVVAVDFEHTRVQVKERDEEGEGHWIDVDVILGADGVKSVVRKSMLEKHGEDGEGFDLRSIHHQESTQDQGEQLGVGIDGECSMIGSIDGSILPNKHVKAISGIIGTVFTASMSSPSLPPQDDGGFCGPSLAQIFTFMRLLSVLKDDIIPISCLGVVINGSGKGETQWEVVNRRWNQFENRSVKDTGQAASRVMLPHDQLEHDLELLAFLESNMTFHWIGAKRHVISNVNFAAEPTATQWKMRADKSAMLQVYPDFCPLVMRMLELIPARCASESCMWVEGGVALLGDVCHSTLPHLNQPYCVSIIERPTPSSQGQIESKPQSR